MKKTPIFSGKIEKFDHKILTNYEYKNILSKHISGKSGIYALYNKNENLYYIGRTTRMFKRIKDHKQDHHAKKWETFSVLFTKSEQHAGPLEDAFISIIKPKGNKKTPLKIKSLNKQITKEMQEVSAKTIHDLTEKKSLKRNIKKKKRIKAVKKRKTNKTQAGNPFKKRVTLRAQYKNKKYKAYWLPSGKVKYKSKNPYNSPHAVAQYIVNNVCGKKTGVNKKFWKVQKKRNKWVSLYDL